MNNKKQKINKGLTTPSQAPTVTSGQNLQSQFKPIQSSNWTSSPSADQDNFRETVVTVPPFSSDKKKKKKIDANDRQDTMDLGGASNNGTFATAIGEVGTGARARSEEEEMLSSAKLSQRLINDITLSEWERELIEECLGLPFDKWMASASEIMKYCPKVHALAKHRYQKELGQTEGDTLAAKKPVASESSASTTLTRVLSEPTFIQFPQQCTVETFDAFTSSILDGESKGWTYDRKANLRSADVSSFNSILGSSHAPIEKVVRESWINPELVKTDVWLGALRSAMFGHSHHSASPIENFQREETLNPLLIDMTKPTNTVFNISQAIDAIRVNHPTIHAGPHTPSDLKTLLKGTVDTMQLENGAPKVRNRFRDFFKEKQDSGLSYIEILTLIPAKHQELIAQAREVSNWISLRHLDIAFGSPSGSKEHAKPEKLTKVGGHGHADVS